MSTKRDLEKAAGWNPLSVLSKWGVRSNHAYAAGFAAVGLSLLSWLLSRGKNDSKPQSDRWGLFVGEWAPTFFALGVGLKLEED
ncbi:hypothetical protein N8K70_06775 [Microbacterium betulae]|uniref:Uncharacterized protein n=1 Tax=Microbacterium betulae TaxID=2981139 RepID=A0AA97FLA3_9MICO|nr:hypothetical protein [Microbacterium sp. AB]WOF24365.1 hypothetical protein N8K70_06775 [Microbacterium sp. AB]